MLQEFNAGSKEVDPKIIVKKKVQGSSMPRAKFLVDGISLEEVDRYI